MKTIEHRDEVNKSGWGGGPWNDEPDRKQWPDATTGLPCLAVRHPSLGHWCGYVGVPEGHPWHGKGYDGLGLYPRVHGGLTYADQCSGQVCHEPEEGEPDIVWWLGFDCAHAWDLSPGIKALSGRDTYRTLAYVERECATLAYQAILAKEGRLEAYLAQEVSHD